MAVARIATRGVREKYVAFVSATRAALLAGLVPFLFFCVWYLAIDVVVGWSWPLLAKHVIGPHDFLIYSLFDDWRQLGQDTLTYALRLPLLAAGFALVTRRLRARRNAAW